MSIALGIALILALTAATGYFVAQEFAYVAVDRNALKELAAQGDEPAQRALKVTSRLSFTLSAAQFGITVTALLVGYISEPLVGAGHRRAARPLDVVCRPPQPVGHRRADLLDRRADGLRRAGSQEPRDRPHRAARPRPVALDPGLSHRRGPARAPLRPRLDDPAAQGRHRARRGARARCDRRGPHPHHRRVPRRRPARRRPVRGPRGRPALPPARRGRGHDPARAGADRARRRPGAVASSSCSTRVGRASP